MARSSAAVRAGQAEEERRRQEEEAARRREWAAKPPEERIAGRLQFWVLGQRAKRHEPTEAEIAARRAELLAELAIGGTARPSAPGDALAGGIGDGQGAWLVPGELGELGQEGPQSARCGRRHG